MAGIRSPDGHLLSSRVSGTAGTLGRRGGSRSVCAGRAAAPGSATPRGKSGLGPRGDVTVRSVTAWCWRRLQRRQGVPLLRPGSGEVGSLLRRRGQVQRPPAVAFRYDMWTAGP